MTSEYTGKYNQMGSHENSKTKKVMIKKSA